MSRNTLIMTTKTTIRVGHQPVLRTSFCVNNLVNASILSNFVIAMWIVWMGTTKLASYYFFNLCFLKINFLIFFSACSVAKPDRTCPNDEFLCDADQCIPDSKICNGFNDCMDGSDEHLYLYYWRHLSIQNQSINCI